MTHPPGDLFVFSLIGIDKALSFIELGRGSIRVRGLLILMPSECMTGDVLSQKVSHRCMKSGPGRENSA